MAASSAKVKGPAFGRPLKIAVIGAGLSGLFAARTLNDHGHRVQVFEKKVRPGGRVATQIDSSVGLPEITATPGVLQLNAGCFTPGPKGPKRQPTGKTMKPL
jgi:monoamine oxidase